MWITAKCNFDVEMTMDMLDDAKKLTAIMLFSGDGDLATALKYLNDEYNKETTVMSARGHIGREIIDAKRGGIVKEILYADDFEYRLNMERFRKK